MQFFISKNFSRLFIFICLYSIGIFMMASPSQTLSAQEINPDDLDFYLHTTDVGYPVPEKYGHAGLRVINKAQRQDVIFNWGMYDFNQPGFVKNFIAGRLMYRLAIYKTFQAQISYKRYKRSVWEDRLNFTDEQKIKFYKIIMEQSLPQNMAFAYHYRLDNCSTRIRDFVDQAIDGRLQQKSEQAPKLETFRESVRVHQTTTPFTEFFTDVVFNNKVDRPMTPWQKMYLPIFMREYFMGINQNIDGKTIPLLTPVMRVENDPTPIRNYWLDVWMVMGLHLLAIICLFLIYRNRNIFLKFFLCAYGLFYALILPFISLYTAWSWGFSDHIDLWHNANLMYIWPLDMLLMFAVVKYALYKRFRPGAFMRTYAKAHLIAIAIVIILSLVGVIQQNIWLSLIGFGMPVVIASLLILITHRSAKKDQLIA